MPAVRTLLVSDLHLGQRPGGDTLRLDAARARLLDALDGVDRLVLLGDTVELGSRIHRRRPMEVARPVLGAIAARMGPEREIVLVPGNHDGALVREWVRARGAALGLDDEVPPDATRPLAAVTAMLAPARVTVRYPGVWVREDVWATHGHYLDRHLMPESTFGVTRGHLRRPAPDARPEQYEGARRRRARRARESRGMWSSLRERPLATVLEQCFELTRHTTQLLRHAGLASVTSGLLDVQVRRAAVPAMAYAAGRLGVDARFVVFGHVHRAGPDPGVRWQPWGDTPRLLNTGSWVYEPLLLGNSRPPRPYWPGGAVLVAGDEDPEVRHLLDDLPGGALAGTRRPGDR